MSDTGGQAAAPPPVSQALLDKALARLREIMRGNGVPVEAATLKEFSGGIIEFEARNTFRVIATVNDQYVSGKQNGKILKTEADLRQQTQQSIEQAALNPSIHQAVRESLKKRKDLGFAAKKQVMQLPAAAAKYVVHLPCDSCKGSRGMPCRACRGTGKAPCNKCMGKREIICPMCRGNTQQNCSRCQGRRRIGCTQCKQTGQMRCLKCKGSGKVSCLDCGGSGWRTLVSSLSFRAEGRFEYDRHLLPAAAASMIDRLKGQMVTGRHAGISFLEAPAPEGRGANYKTDEFVIPYSVRLPLGQIAFDIKGNEVKGLLFGEQPLLLDMPPFIEKMAGRGLKALGEAAQAKGDAKARLDEALKYRLVADIVLAAVNAPGKEIMLLERTYPFGIGEGNFRGFVRQAKSALEKLIFLPRLIGFGIGLLLSGILYALYYFGPLKHALLPLPNAPSPPGFDLLLVLAGVIFTSLATWLAAARALQNELSRLRAGKQKKPWPKFGASLLAGGIGAIVLYFIVIQVAVTASHAAPAWYATLLRMI